jgi:hypothetical protein
VEIFEGEDQFGGIKDHPGMVEGPAVGMDVIHELAPLNVLEDKVDFFRVLKGEF